MGIEPTGRTASLIWEKPDDGPDATADEVVVEALRALDD